MDPLPALDKAMSRVLIEQNKHTSIPKRFTSVIREIWLMQFRLPKRFGERPFKLLAHPRFRAAYDFLALRALAGDAPMELADWWTSFQDLPIADQKKMIKASEKQHNLKSTKNKKR